MSCRSRRCGSTVSTIAIGRDVRLDGGARDLCRRAREQEQREIYAELVVDEVGAIENKMVDAAAMAKGLGEAGHIALYGIYFDTDKAVVKPESAPTLEQIAKLMAGQPELNVFIVGHTDNQGAYDYNMDLSRRRAEAVAAALAKNYGVAQRGCRPRASASSRRSPLTRMRPAARRTGGSSWWRRKAGIINTQPWSNRGELNEGKIVGGKPVIARRHPTTLFDPVEESFDPVASTVEIRAEADRIAAIAFRRDVGPCALLHGKLSDPVGVIASVGKQHCPGFQTRQPFSGKPNVVCLAGAQRQPYR